eukprot:jgi/Botrbrau1/16402/Bobra.0142s0002.1
MSESLRGASEACKLSGFPHNERAMNKHFGNPLGNHFTVTQNNLSSSILSGILWMGNRLKSQMSWGLRRVGTENCNSLHKIAVACFLFTAKCNTAFRSTRIPTPTGSKIAPTPDRLSFRRRP